MIDGRGGRLKVVLETSRADRMPFTESYTPASGETPVLETTVGEVLRDAAARWPDRLGLVEADVHGALGRRWTFRELIDDAERLAVALASRYAPGERICVWAPNLPEWVILEYGAALAGLTLVTANPAYRPRELAYVLEQSRSVGLFIAPAHRGTPMAEIAAEVAAALPVLREVVDVTQPGQLFATGAAPRGLPEVSPGDAAQIQYTSGTTGFPKGALLHHRGLVNNARLTFGRAGVREGETVLNFMPMFHTSGCACLTLGAAQSGSTMIIAALFDPGRMLDIIEAEKLGFVMGVPTMLVGLLEAQSVLARDLASVRMIVSGGAMVPPELVRRVREVFGCDFETVYGQTESSPVVTQTAADDSLDDLCGTVGRALPQTEISIRDPATNTVVPVGQVGEICARGYCVMLGYNDNPDATAKAIDPDGWLHTGDLGTMDARGYVRVTGRVKEMIIRGGENLFPAEIENILLEHPDVAEVAVVGVPDERWGEVVACFMRLTPGAAFDPAVLRAHCRVNLSPQKTPAHWIAVTDWPLTGSGKIQKFVLRDRFVAGEFDAAHAIA
jgi:fatty-acyl-CoA synthase